jgi:hypothetical protein
VKALLVNAEAIRFVGTAGDRLQLLIVKHKEAPSRRTGRGLTSEGRKKTNTLPQTGHEISSCDGGEELKEELQEHLTERNLARGQP